MSREATLEKIAELCRTVFEDEKLEITKETAAKDVEAWDSLTHIILISEIENAFGIKFTLDEIQKARNVGELVSIIEGK